MIYKDYKYSIDDDVQYYTLQLLLSHDCDISWAWSIRNLGKSYDALRLVRKTMNNGRNCVWLRWSKAETELAIEEFMRYNIDNKYRLNKIPNSSASVIRQIDNDKCCYFMPVKMASNLKGLDIPDVRYCVYDECIPEFYDIKTRRDSEFNKFMSLYKTLKRDTKDFKVIMLCNVIDWFNGFTRAWNVAPFDSGIIRVFTNNVNINVDGDNYKTSVKIAFDNVKPSKAMLLRNIKDEGLKGDNKSVEKYLSNNGYKQYNLIENCPNMTLPLVETQFYRDDKYYSYRIYGDNIYFVETKKRDGVIDVFKPEDVGEMKIRRPFIGKSFEDLINQGRCKFSNGHVYNAIISGIWDYRKRI